MKTKIVKPYAMLYSQGREYFLLFPEPLEQDSWEQSGTYRFVVVPRKVITTRLVGDWFQKRRENIYSHARHIVTTSFTIEFANMPEIVIKLAEPDLSEYELNFETNKEERCQKQQ